MGSACPPQDNRYPGFSFKFNIVEIITFDGGGIMLCVCVVTEQDVLEKLTRHTYSRRP